MNIETSMSPGIDAVTEQQFLTLREKRLAAQGEADRPQMDLATYRKNHSLSLLVRRALWECVQLPFIPIRPRSLSPLRVALLRLFGAKVGKNVLICGGVRVHVPWNLELGDYVAIGDKVEIYNLAPISVGAHTVVSQRVYLCGSTHDYTRTDFPLYSLPITIGSQAWIAAGAFVSPGITVGEGSVVGANSVVTRDIPAWTVAAGNPCRVLKQRDLQSPSGVAAAADPAATVPDPGV